jgi:hypothetical protein
LYWDLCTTWIWMQSLNQPTIANDLGTRFWNVGQAFCQYYSFALSANTIHLPILFVQPIPHQRIGGLTLVVLACLSEHRRTGTPRTQFCLEPVFLGLRVGHSLNTIPPRSRVSRVGHSSNTIPPRSRAPEAGSREPRGLPREQLEIDMWGPRNRPPNQSILIIKSSRWSSSVLMYKCAIMNWTLESKEQHLRITVNWTVE